MARGRPGIWSFVIGVPLVLVGGFLYGVAGSHPYPALVGLPFVAFGIFIILAGLYVHFVAAPDPPTLREGEEIVDKRHPTQRVAQAKMGIGFPFLLVAAYLLFFTKVPYVYPTATFVVGLYFFSTGIHTYWTNSLTTYYLTNQRVIREYRFLSLIRQELPLEKVRGVEERKSITEALVGLGNVRVASGGGGGTLQVVMRNIGSATKFADEIRELV